MFQHDTAHSGYSASIAPRTNQTVWNVSWSNWVSSPSVSVGIVYLDWNSLFNALNATTGAYLWSYPTGAVYGSPAVANGIVYFGSGDGNVYALNARAPASAAGYTVTFTQSGLLTETEWSVTFNGITSGGSSDTITFYGVEDGAYSFTVSNVSGYVAAPADESVAVASPSSGTIAVNGANTNQSIRFQYTVTSWDPVKNSYNTQNFPSIWWGGNCYGFSSTALLYFTHYTLGDNTYPYFPLQYPQANSTSDLDISGAILKGSRPR